MKVNDKVVLLRDGMVLFFIFLIHATLTNGQPLTQQAATPAVPDTDTTMNDIESYGGDVLVVADDAELFVYYENYLLYSTPTSSYSQGSPLRVAGCPVPTVGPAPAPTVPTACQITSNAAGQSLQTFDVLIGGLPYSNGGAGSVVVWKDTRVDWSQQQVLVARDALANDNFGYDVALDINNPHISIIGAPNSDDLGTSSGSAYIFASSPTGKFWTEGQRLTGSTETANCQFGAEVQVMGHQSVVLAPGCCKVFLFEQEKPKPAPPPPPRGCGSDDDHNHTSSTSSSSSSSSLPPLNHQYENIKIHPYEDIHQVKTLQWSEQQVLDFTAGTYCTQFGTGVNYMTMSYDDGNLILGFPYYDNGGVVDSGLVLSVALETFRGDCNSNIFPTMLSFEELIEMKEVTMRVWETQYSGRGGSDDSHCTHPPKPTPQCEVSRWSLQQTINPALYECSYYGSNVAVCEDLMFVQSSNYETVDGDNPSNCNQDMQTGYNPDFMDGAVLVYERKSDGTWTWLQTIEPTVNSNENFGDPLTCSGANAYWGQTAITTYTVPRPTPTPTPTTDEIYIDDYLDTTTYHYNQDSQWDCVILMLGDHFGDGWNGADLVITGPGADKQRYTDSCDSISNPYYIRWCPIDNNVCGEVTMEIPGAAGIPFHPEIYWGVYLEDTGTWVYGDHATKLTFDWDCDNHDLSLIEGKHVLTNTSCDCDCQTFRPTPKPTPREKPVSGGSSGDDSNSRFPTHGPSHIPTLFPSPARRILLSPPELENQDSTPISERKLKSGDDDKTHRPTVSPAPTLDIQPYTDGHWEWLTMYSAPDAVWCSGSTDMTRGTMYYIYDKTGTKLLQSGTKCALLDLRCWMVLPPDGDYIMRIGGALDADHGNYHGRFCGYLLDSPSHFEFSITADQQCIPQEYYSRTTYCTEVLDVQALISGVILIKDLYLTEGLSGADRLIIQNAFNNLFGNVGITANLRSENSAEGLLVSFTIGVPISYYGFTNKLYNGPHLTYLLAHDDLLNSFNSDLFTVMLDSQTHAFLNQGLSSRYGQLGQCHLKSHGTLSLLSLTEDGWKNEVPSTERIDPITYYPESDDTTSKTAMLSSFETGIPTFFIVVLVGGTILYFLYSSKIRKVSSNIDSSIQKSTSPASYFKQNFKYIYAFTHVRTPSRENSESSGNSDYQVLRTPSDDVEAHHEKRKTKQKKSSNSQVDTKLDRIDGRPPSSSSSSSSSSATKRKLPQNQRSSEKNDNQSDGENETEINEDVLSLIKKASQSDNSNSKAKSKNTKSNKSSNTSSSNQFRFTRTVNSNTQSTSRSNAAAAGEDDDGDDSDEFDYDSLVEVLQNHR